MEARELRGIQRTWRMCWGGDGRQTKTREKLVLTDARFPLAGASICTLCPDGTYSNSAGTDSCVHAHPAFAQQLQFVRCDAAARNPLSVTAFVGKATGSALRAALCIWGRWCDSKNDPVGLSIPQLKGVIAYGSALLKKMSELTLEGTALSSLF